MKRTRIMTVEEEDRFCDMCKNSQLASYWCHGCNCDLCTVCSIYERDGGGDYPDSYCSTCWQAGKKYRDAINKLHEKIWDLKKKWAEECKNIAKWRKET